LFSTKGIFLDIINQISTSMFNDLKKLIDNKEYYTDVLIKIDEKTSINSHKLFLSRSPYFDTMLK
jgi:hypothetical protein